MPASPSTSESSPATEHATATAQPLRRSATARSTTCRSAPPVSRESTTSSNRTGRDPVSLACLTAVSWPEPRGRDERCGESARWPLLPVVVEAEVGDQILPPYGPQGVLELHQLYEEVVLRVELRQDHRALEVEREPLLDTPHPRSLGQVQKQRQVEHEGRGEDRVARQEVYLYLHRVAQPAEDVYVVPALLGVAAGWVVVDLHQVRYLAVELGVEVGLQDIFQHGELGDFLGLQASFVVEDLAVPISEDVGRVPALEAQRPGLQARRHDGLQEGLAGLEVLARDRYPPACSQLDERRDVGRERWGAVRVWDALHDRRVGVDHGRRDSRIRSVERPFEGF